VIDPGAPVAQRLVFQRVYCDVDVGNLASVRKCSTNLLADIKHGRFVALAFADYDRPAHRNRVHDLAHSFSGDLIAQGTVSLTHGARRSNSCVLDHPQELQR
jgi:hypothetical protein